MPNMKGRPATSQRSATRAPPAGQGKLQPKPDEFEYRTLPDYSSSSMTVDRASLDRRRRQADAADAARREGAAKLFADEIEQNKQRLQEMSKHHYMPSPQHSPLPRYDYRDLGEDPASKKKPAVKQQQGVRAYAKALFRFQAQGPKEISFHKGDTIYLNKQIDDNWLEGEIDGKFGIFPSSFVEVVVSLEYAEKIQEVIESMDEVKTDPAQETREAKVKFDFDAASLNELSLKKGEVVTLLREVDDNWYEGAIRDRRGIFPVAYVEVMRETSARPSAAAAAAAAATAATAATTHHRSSASLSPRPDGAASSQRSPIAPGSGGSSRHTHADGAASSQRSPIAPGSGGSGRHTHTDVQDASAAIGRRAGQPDSSPASGRKEYQQMAHRWDAREVAPHVEVADTRGPHTKSYEDHMASLRAAKKVAPSVDVFNGPTSPLASPRGSAKSMQSAGMVQQSHDPNPPQLELPDEAPIETFRAMYAYRPQNQDELELQEGDTVYVMEKCDDGWFVGSSLRTGRFGTFPGNYVDPSSALDDYEKRESLSRTPPLAPPRLLHQVNNVKTYFV